jgi:hypothetical protein
LFGRFFNATEREEGERPMAGKRDQVRNWHRVRGAWLLSALLMTGSAGGYGLGEKVDPGATLDGYGDPYMFSDPDYGGLRLLDPGYAFSAYDVYGYPGSGFRDFGRPGNYGYSGYGSYPDYGYGSATRSPAFPPSYGGGAPSSGVASDRAYIRQLEERIRKLELANKQQQLPPYGVRPNPQAWPSFSPTQPGYEPKAAGQFGQRPAHSGGGAGYGNHSDYPIFQPSYGGPPTYQFR